MSDHLPECPCNHADERGCFLISAETDRCVSCICPALRSCEQRVRLEYRVGLADYAAGLDAARDAIKASVLVWDATDDYTYGLRDAVAAIDALRGEL